MLRKLVVLLTFVVLACAPADVARADWILDQAGYGPVRFGMPRRQVSSIVGPLAPIMYFSDPESCTIEALPNEPGLHFVFRHGRLALIDAHTAPVIWTQYRLSNASSEAEITGAFGEELTSEPDPERASPNRHLVAYDPQTRLGLVFMTSPQMRQGRMRAGQIREVNLDDCYRITE